MNKEQLTVGEVIESLSKYPSNAVVCRVYDGRGPCVGVHPSYWDDIYVPVVMLTFAEKEVATLINDDGQDSTYRVSPETQLR